ncbi:MAG: KH domain-containing protein [Thermoplasmatota archaeon]
MEESINYELKPPGRTTGDIVMPGDIISSSEGMKPGRGVFKEGGRLVSSVIGMVAVKGSTASVLPLNDRYIPKPGDQIIGMVVDLGPDHWIVDVNSTRPLVLNVGDTPWNVRFGHSSSYLDVGDVVHLKVERDRGASHLKLAMKGPALRKLNQGYLVSINVSKVIRLVGKDMEMINLIRRATSCRILVGQNGMIWIEGDPEGVSMVERTVDLIGRYPHSMPLNGKIRELLS